MQDERKPDTTKNQEHLERLALLTGAKPEDFTCYSCEERDACPFAYEPYNTDGDCLAEK